MIVPSIVRREPFVGTGYLPQSEEDLYKTQDGDYLAGTAEVATMGYYMDEILDEKELPMKFFSFSPCFRREAGSHGKDTKGLFRIHEFVKYEQVVLCEAIHEESVQIARRADREFRRTPAGIEIAVPCRRQLRRRPRLGSGEKVRHRSMDAEREKISRDALLVLFP